MTKTVPEWKRSPKPALNLVLNPAINGLLFTSTKHHHFPFLPKMTDNSTPFVHGALHILVPSVQLHAFHVFGVVSKLYIENK